MPITCYTTTGLSLYALFGDTSDTAVALTEGSSHKLGAYTASDAAIAGASLAAGDWPYRILIGSAGSKSASDPQVGAGSLRWSGSAEVLANATAPLDATGVRSAVGLASANLDTQLASKATSTNVTSAQTAITTAIGALNNLSQAQAQSAAAAAITAADLVTSLTAAIQDGLLNEADGKAVLAAIADKIAADWVAGDASPVAIVAAINANATQQALQTNVSSLKTLAESSQGFAAIRALADTAATQATSAASQTTNNAIRAAVGLPTANLNTLLTGIGDKLPASGVVPNTTQVATPTNVTNAQTAIIGHGDTAWAGGGGVDITEEDVEAIAEAVVAAGGGGAAPVITQPVLAHNLIPFGRMTDGWVRSQRPARVLIGSAPVIAADTSQWGEVAWSNMDAPTSSDTDVATGGSVVNSTYGISTATGTPAFEISPVAAGECLVTVDGVANGQWVRLVFEVVVVDAEAA